MSRESEIEWLKNNLKDSIAVVGAYQWLIDSFVLDYYTENHWQRLPSSWRAAFRNLNDVSELSDLLLNFEDSGCFTVLPLSLLSLKKCVHKLSASRKVLSVKQSLPKKNHLYKQVKDKKCHEIDRMAELTAATAKRCSDTKYVVDFGAGLGHLARILAFQHGIISCCLEQQEKLSSEAK